MYKTVITILLVFLILYKISEFQPFKDINKNLCNSKIQGRHFKVLSYVVFGNGTRHNGESKFRNKPYVEDLRDLVQQKRKSEFYNDWQMRVYHSNQLFMRELENEFLNEENVYFCNVIEITRHNYQKINSTYPVFWRNLPLGDLTVDISCFRDVDSDLTKREEAAVSDWLKTNHVIHLMRDHPNHFIPILAGMWCFRNELYHDLGRELLSDIISTATQYRLGHYEQPILNAIVWERLQSDAYQHDAFNCDHFPRSLPFPTRRENKNSFVGCVFHDCKQYLPPCPVICRPSYGKNWTFC